METTMKTMLAKKNSEMEKLERSEKSQLRMITSSAARIRLRYGRAEEENKNSGETEVIYYCEASNLNPKVYTNSGQEQARKIRMYETHNPGFCYLRNGEYRKKASNNSTSTSLDPIQCSEKVKAILFTDDALDINKTVCLHLLGTHLQSKNHIQRKDGRLCSYVKAQVSGNTANTLQAVSQRVGSHVNDRPSKYDKMLPRYILEVALLNRNISMSSVRSSDCESGSDDESKKKRKLLVPVYINNEIRMIIHSVLEALQDVKSYKLQALIDLASSPEALRNLLAKEEMQEYIVDLAGNPLIMKPTSYDYVMAHIMFDKIPEKGTMETVAQVLEVCDYSELRDCLKKIRRCLFQRHLDLVNSNILPGKKTGALLQRRAGKASYESFLLTKSQPGQEKISSIDNLKFFNSNIRYLTNPNSGMLKPSTESNLAKNVKSTSGSVRAETLETIKEKSDKKEKNVILEKESTEEREIKKDTEYNQGRSNTESTKCDLRYMSNAQRILVGLKVASLKSRPLNMHQLEGRKKMDLAAIINPIIRSQGTDVNAKQQPSDLGNFSVLWDHLLNKVPIKRKGLTPNGALQSETELGESEKRVKKSISRISTVPVADLENLTRPLLANLRLEISESENKRRVNCVYVGQPSEQGFSPYVQRLSLGTNVTEVYMEGNGCNSVADKCLDLQMLSAEFKSFQKQKKIFNVASPRR